MISARVFLLCNNLLLPIRFIISAMQISREIERVGDLSMSIIKLTKSIKEKHELISKFNIADIVRSEVITIRQMSVFKIWMKLALKKFSN
jgi:phosphate transport system protein